MKVIRIRRKGIKPADDRYFTPVSIAISAVLILGLFVFNAIDVVDGSQRFGSIGILAGTLAAFQGAFFFHPTTSREGYPVLSMLVTAVILSQLIAFRSGPRPDPALQVEAAAIPESKTAFEEWLKARKPEIGAYATQFPGKKYPIFLIAAQGGGYYAGYHTALFSRSPSGPLPRLRQPRLCDQFCLRRKPRRGGLRRDLAVPSGRDQQASALCARPFAGAADGNGDRALL